MALNLTVTAQSIANQIAKTPQLIAEIEGKKAIGLIAKAIYDRNTIMRVAAVNILTEIDGEESLAKFPARSGLGLKRDLPSPDLYEKILDMRQHSSTVIKKFLVVKFFKGD